MSRDLRIPGVIGALAAVLGLQPLADLLSSELAKTHPGTLRKWGHNQTRTPGPAGALLARICCDQAVMPILYIRPELPGFFLASLPGGWVEFGPGEKELPPDWMILGEKERQGGWRVRAPHPFEVINPGFPNKAEISSARALGWPW
jgi:hypothetical protein